MNKSNPIVGIGLPVFNGERYLAEALDSLLAQTFADFELIISDNGSTDRTQTICQAYVARDRRLRYYRNDTNLGAAKNYNRVFELSTGKYFKWMSHDDVCAPEFLAHCINVLESEANVVLCYPRTTFIDEQGEAQGYYVDNLDLRSPIPHRRLRQILGKKSGHCHPVFGVIRSNVLKRTALIGNYPRSDKNLLGELSLWGQFRELPEHLFYRRLHPLMSTAVNVTEWELAAWYDPMKRDKVIFPRWRRFFEYFKVIRRAPLSWSERLRCYAEVGRFVFYPKKWAGIGDDLLHAVQRMPD